MKYDLAYSARREKKSTKCHSKATCCIENGQSR